MVIFDKHCVSLCCSLSENQYMNHIAYRLKSHTAFIIFSVLFAWMQGNITYAQFYESGTEPTSVRWRQINTGHFRVIYPVGADSAGQRAANTLEYIYIAEGKTLNHYPKKISVVLHNRPVLSNGFVSWAPKRSEWYLTPPQDNDAHNWQDQLAVHEFRHVVQIDKLNQGFTKALGFAIGQQAVGVVSGLLPKWFLEGDAVATETALSNAGRGRNPAFEMPLRTIALSGKYQQYDKALFGSYRDHVPDHYELGYQMVSWIREKYGPRTFETTVDYVAHEPYFFFLYPFKLGLKKETGYVTGQLYRHAFDDLTQRWHEQEQKTGYDSIPPVTQRTTDMYASYRSPQYINDSLFVVQKTGIAQIAQWVLVDKHGNERKIHTPGIINSERITYSNGLLAWTEEVQDVRWTNRSYSVVKLYDIQTGKERMLQRHTRFFSPVLSPDGKTLAVVEIPVVGDCTIVLIDVATGKEKERLPNPGSGALLQTPSWSRNGKSLLVIVNNKEGKSIARLDVTSGLYTTVLPSTYDDIAYPADGGTHVFFTSYYNGITNIYAVDVLNGKVAQVTSSRFGAFDPQPNPGGNRMAYAEYSVKGYDLVETNLDASQWTPVEQMTDHSLKLYETLARQENFNVQDSVIPASRHKVKPYRKWSHLFNVHSWAPLYYEVDASDVTSTELYPGLVLLSQDLLGNLTSSVGYSWRGYNAYHAAFTYKGLYPVFDFKFDYGGQKVVYGGPTDRPVTFNPQGKNTEIDVRSYIPFVLTRNRYVTGLVPQAKLTYNSSYLYSQETDTYQPGLWELGYSLQVYRFLKTSRRDLAPRFGALVQGVFQHAPFNSEQLGYIYYMYGRVYLPGVVRHHSLQISAVWQQQKPNDLMFGTLINFPRGYSNRGTEKLSMATFNYSLPLMYPDWQWSFLVYAKRLRTNLFCDIAENRYRMLDRNINQLFWQSDRMLSVGIDLLADVNLLQINFPINLGVRTVYVPETGKVQASLLFNVTLN